MTEGFSFGLGGGRSILASYQPLYCSVRPAGGLAGPPAPLRYARFARARRAARARAVAGVRPATAGKWRQTRNARPPVRRAGCRRRPGRTDRVRVAWPDACATPMLPAPPARVVEPRRRQAERFRAGGPCKARPSVALGDGGPVTQQRHALIDHLAQKFGALRNAVARDVYVRGVRSGLARGHGLAVVARCTTSPPLPRGLGGGRARRWIAVVLGSQPGARGRNTGQRGANGRALGTLRGGYGVILLGNAIW